MAVLLVFFYPVTQTKERWIAHLHLEWSTLHFVRVWAIDGRQTASFVLGCEVAVALLIGGLVWMGMSDTENQYPER